MMKTPKVDYYKVLGKEMKRYKSGNLPGTKTSSCDYMDLSDLHMPFLALDRTSNL
jgi:hypothetical protein